MAVTVGTDSYIDVADADTYWSNRNNSDWSGASQAEKEAALREATQYVDGAFDWIGDLQSDSQSLAWPRINAYITEGPFRGKLVSENYPQKVKDATCELALEALGGRLEPIEERGGDTKREKVGPIEIEYADAAPATKTFGFVRKLLRGYYRSGHRLKRV